MKAFTKQYTKELQTLGSRYQDIVEAAAKGQPPPKLTVALGTPNQTLLSMELRDTIASLSEDVKNLSPRDTIVRPSLPSIVSKPMITKVDESSYRLLFAVNMYHLIVGSSMWQSAEKLIPTNQLKKMYVPESIMELQVYRHKDGEPDVLVGSPQPTTFVVADDVVHYMITDSNYDSDGTYTYTVKMTYLDPLMDWVMERASTLSEANRNIQQYLNECDQPGRFSPDTKMYTESAKTQLTALLEKKYKLYISSLFKALLELGLIDARKMRRLVDATVFALHPATGNPTSVETLLNDLNAAIQHVLFLLGEKDVTIPHNKTASATVKATGGTRKKSAGRIQTVSFDLSERVVINRLDKKNHADYLEVLGGGVVPVNSLTDRIMKEVRSLFTNDTAKITYGGNIPNTLIDSPQTTAYSYLSPMSLTLGHREVYKILDDLDKNKFNQLLVDLLTGETTKEPELDLFTPSTSVKLTDNQQTLKQQLSISLASMGATIEYDAERNRSVGQTIRENKMTNQQGVVVASRLIGSAETKNRVVAPGEKDAQSNDSLVALVCLDKLNLNKYSLANYNLSSTSVQSKLARQYPSPNNRAEAIKNLPNQIKYLLKKNDKDTVVKSDRVLDSTDFLRDPTRFFYSWNRLLNIKELRRLVGYDKDEKGISIINSPRYLRVTSADLSNAPFLCSMVDYKNTVFGVYDEQLLELPTANSFFVVVNGAATATRTTPRRTTAAPNTTQPAVSRQEAAAQDTAKQAEANTAMAQRLANLRR